MGEQSFLILSGLGPPIELINWCADKPATARFSQRRDEIRLLFAAAGNEAAALIARGMGHAAGERRPEPACAARMLGELFPATDQDMLRLAFYQGIGEGQAREWLARARSWVSPEGGLCRDVPMEFARVCDESFKQEMQAFGFRLRREELHGMIHYYLDPAIEE